MQKLVLTKAAANAMIAPANGVDLKQGDSIIVAGLAGAETVGLYVKVGTTFVPAKDSTGTALELTATVDSLTIGGAGTYQIQTSTSAGALAISFNTP